ncbi:hypothetical protein WQ57_09960 [Mesobacillus campisalis]|uniref:Uncharacterized protein n=1 Tax=Mesobacillus campisalis TaxID=1408103 RepID=A0A0M2SVD7_9BACI|nr:hypothetical protein [Mesobacillus campisalis]KKK38133.1 hypothetical protein WQ57_09960 [Mesobacillus campisalis]
MLLVRHAIGSRLFYQTEHYEIKKNEDKWIISFPISYEKAMNIQKFKEELNLFAVEDTQKTWYYSSDAELLFDKDNEQLLVFADHKTVYPI